MKNQTPCFLRRAALICLVQALALLVLAPSAGAAGRERLIAPASVCPHQGDVSDPVAVQVGAMRCLVDHAREGMGLAVAGEEVGLNRAAKHKSADILRCDEFSHEACGRKFTYWIQHFGYLGPGCSGAAENIAWGTGKLGSAGSIFRAWMRSPGHRRNILGPYALIGIGLRTGRLDGHARAHVWTQEFAGRGC